MAQRQLPDRTLAWPICWEAVELIALSESLRLKAYRCPAGIWTCGWGETDGVRPGDRWTKAYADQRLLGALTEFRDRVLALCKRSPSDNELGAFVALAYNIGVPAFSKSSVLKAHNRGDHQAAARAFGLWNKATVNGKLTVLNGLTIRRAKESALYLTPDADEIELPTSQTAALPQAVASESKLTASPIAQSGAVTAATGALTLLSSISEPVKQAGEQLQAVTDTATQAHAAAGTLAGFLGVQPLTLLALTLVIAGGVALYWRIKQRREGYA